MNAEKNLQVGTYGPDVRTSQRLVPTGYVVRWRKLPLRFFKNACGWQYAIVPIDDATVFESEQLALSRARETTLGDFERTITPIAD